MRPTHARRRLARGRLIALGTCALLLLALPTAAAAHAELERSMPADGAMVPSPFDGPIVLEFSAPLALGSKADLIGPGGGTVATAAVDGPAATMTLTLQGTLDAGPYEVKWTSVAEDTDVARGTVGFTVSPAVASSTPAPTAEPTAAPSASATAAPETTAPETTAPEATALASSEPPASAGASPAGSSDASGGGADVVLPIIVALLVVGAGAVYLVARRNRPRAPG